MRRFLPGFAIVVFLGLILFPRRDIVSAQMTPNPTAGQLKQAAAASCDFWCSLVNALTGGGKGQNIPETLEDLTRARTPFQMGVVPPNGPTAIPSGTVQGISNQSQVLGTDTDVVRDAGYQYGLQNSMQTNEAASTNGNDFFTQLGIALSNLLGIKNEGNEQAIEYAAGHFPPGVAESALARLSNPSTELTQEDNSAGSQVLGSAACEGMVCGLGLVQCGSLPYGVGGEDCKGLLAQGPTVMPYPSPTSVVTPQPTAPATNPSISPYPSPTIPGGILANCTGTTSYCSTQCLRQFFPTDESARLASIICRRESGGNSAVPNQRCRADMYPDPTRRSRDFSIGLFQINLLVSSRCDQFSVNGQPIIIDNWNTSKSCSSTDFLIPTQAPNRTIKENSPLEKCVEHYSNFVNNILYALELSQNGTNWCPWRTGPVVGDCSIYVK